MEDSEKKRLEIRIVKPAEVTERRDDPLRPAAAIVQRPESWSVFGRPARRLFRVNCGE